MIQNDITIDSDDNQSEKDDFDQEKGSKQNIEDKVPNPLDKVLKKAAVHKQIKLNSQISGGRSSFYFQGGSNPIDVLSALTQFKILQDRQAKNKSRMNQQLDNQSLSLDEIIDLLQIQNEKKRPRDIKNQRKFFHQTQFFQTLVKQEGQEFVDQCIDNLTYKSFKKQQVLFNSSLGEVESDFRSIMILLQGQSRIFYQKECGLKYIVGLPCNFEENSKLISDGYTIGAYEFIQDNTKKNQKKVYSIICDTSCSYVFLDKQILQQLKFIYLSFLLKVQKIRKEKKDQIDFFKTISVFKKFEEMSLVELILLCENESFNRKQYVYEEGDESNFVYFVYKGEFRLQQRKQRKIIQIQKQKKLENTQYVRNSILFKNNKVNENQQVQEYQGQIGNTLKSKSLEDDDDYINDVKKLDLKEIKTLMVQKNKQENIQKLDELTLIIYDQGTLFGEFEIVNEMINAEKSHQIKTKKRLFSIQCMSDEGSCYKISNQRFCKFLNKHKQLLQTLIEANENMGSWINNRIQSVKSQKVLTQNIQLNVSIEKVKEEENNWLKEKEEAQGILIKQHQAATKYLESNLIALQSRIKKEQKDRVHKKFQIAKIITKLRDGRQQFLHNQLKEKIKKDEQMQKQKDLQSSRNRHQPQLNIEDLVSQATIHSQSPRNRILSIQSEKIEKIPSCNSSPKNNDKSIDFDILNNTLQQYNFSKSALYLQQQRRNSTGKEKSLFSERIQNNLSTNTEQIQEHYFAQPKKIVIIPTKNMKSISQWSGKEKPITQKHVSKEYPQKEYDKKDHILRENSQNEQIQNEYFQKKQDIKEQIKDEGGGIQSNSLERKINQEDSKNALYFIRQSQNTKLPQFFIQSSSPLNSQKQIKLNNTYFKRSTTNQSAQTDQSICDNSQLEQNSYEDIQVVSPYQKYKMNSQNLSQTNIISKNELSQELNTKSSISINKFWNKQPQKRSSVLLKQLVQEGYKFQYVHRSLNERLPQSSRIHNSQKIQNSNQNIKIIQKSPYMNQSQNIQNEDNSKFFARPRSNSNFVKNEVPPVQQNEIKQNPLNQTNDSNKLDSNQITEKHTELLQRNKLPLKYFIPQIKTSKISKGFVSHNNQQKPINTEQINLISPRLFAS